MPIGKYDVGEMDHYVRWIVLYFFCFRLDCSDTDICYNMRL